MYFKSIYTYQLNRKYCRLIIVIHKHQLWIKQSILHSACYYLFKVNTLKIYKIITYYLSVSYMDTIIKTIIINYW